MFDRLRLRLTIVCAVSTGLVLLVMAALSLWISVRQIERQSRGAFQSGLNTVFFYLRAQDIIDHTWLSQTEAANHVYLRIEKNGLPILYTTQSPRRESLTGLAAGIALEQYAFDYQGVLSGSLLPETLQFEMEASGVHYRCAAAIVPAGSDFYNVIVVEDTTPARIEMLRLAASFAGLVVLALAGLVLVAWLFTARAVRPIRESRKRQNEFVSAASHELRSPLAVIRVSAETLREAPEKAEDYAEKIVRECDRMTGLTDDLLRLAGADAGNWEMIFSLREPETILLDAAERFEALARQRGVSLQISLPDGALPQLLCDADRLGQVFSILIDNALRYTPSGGVIRLLVQRQRKALCFLVEDSGPGVPDSEKEHIFGRFYRGDSSRTDKEHYGLGLSVAREIAQLHRGTITVRDSSLGGAAFVVTIALKER